jgi:orotidine-5'-phosphate decarboxylase
MTQLRDLLESPAYNYARSHSYLALDVASWEEAERLVDEFGPVVTGYKVGLELFHAAGQRAVERLVKAGKRVFLDVKLHDIPNTVAGALRAIRDSGVEMVNVHALGGKHMLEAARDALDGGRHRPLLIAVTVLTSLSDDALMQMGLPKAQDLVPRLAELAHQCGLDGVVASARDLDGIYQRVPKSFVTVVPGTRLVGGERHDQARTLTPREAVAKGATHLVIGRAVTRAADRWQALKMVWDEMEARKPLQERGGSM